YPYCTAAATALQEERYLDALELAEAGGCDAELAEARAARDGLAARFERCVSGAWSGRGEDAFGIGCAVASDLVVFGDVRDLTREGLAWLRGEEPDEVLMALSAAGIALTFTPQIGAGASLFKAARRAGALGDGFARSLVKLARDRAWRPSSTWRHSRCWRSGGAARAPCAWPPTTPSTARRSSAGPPGSSWRRPAAAAPCSRANRWWCSRPRASTSTPRRWRPRSRR